MYDFRQKQHIIEMKNPNSCRQWSVSFRFLVKAEMLNSRKSVEGNIRLDLQDQATLLCIEVHGGLFSGIVHRCKTTIHSLGHPTHKKEWTVNMAPTRTDEVIIQTPEGLLGRLRLSTEKAN